jgi:hypothetical protein
MWFRGFFAELLDLLILKQFDRVRILIEAWLDRERKLEKNKQADTEEKKREVARDLSRRP